MNRPGVRPGYAFLTMVLLIGALASSLVVTALFLSTSWSRDVVTIRDGAQALALARSCAERALLRLQHDLSYDGNEDIDIGGQTCHIASIGGVGAWSRTICTTGQSHDATRHLEITLSAVLPEVLVSRWEEVSTITLCNGA